MERKSSVGGDVFGISFSTRKCYSARAHRHDRLRRPIMKWVKHGYILLAATDCSLPSIDITVFVDVMTNPGPISSEKSYDLRKQSWSDKSKIPCYGRNNLLGLRKKSGKPSSPVLETLKKLQLLRFRGYRGGLRKNVQHVKERSIQNISVIIGRRAESGSAIPWLRVEKRRNPSNLVSVPKQVVSREHTSASSGQLAVPKLLFIDKCSLGKTKSWVRAVVALEADFGNNDIDACVASETHLKNEVPDTVANISGYNIFRRDRNWSGCDSRNKGGGKKLKPIRQKRQFRDCREHRKRALYLAPASECWDDVLEAGNIETSLNILELKILSNINWCMPLQTVSLSSRDPSWMTPLVKYMLRSKSRISVLRINKHRELSRRVLEVIGENRELLLEGKMGSREWWKNVDLISQRRRSTNVSLYRETAQDLNEYFGNLCTDGD
ncbi:hypothetical protein AWC38_SpisGene22564 [Stylophora pistillata]|uniref:Uncharacterized protein n=1 Tax=Stylophora pistillata TaxID=50429 RepID=A0A2B4RAP3_STYPI|nr:hypothetical protein AWC38_SpisGene22564 [Stylophora pistillata]